MYLYGYSTGALILLQWIYYYRLLVGSYALFLKYAVSGCKFNVVRLRYVVQFSCCLAVDC
jgi:hypothetical protein